MTNGEKLVLILDSTQLSLFDECPYKWSLEYIENLERDTAYKEAMMMGSYGHKLLEIYYKNCSNQVKGREQAMDYRVPTDSNIGILPDYKAIIIEPGIVDIGVKQLIPFQLAEDKQQLVRERFDNYWTQQIAQNSDFVPTSPEHVEVGFSEKIFESHDRLYILEGKIDGIGSISGLPCIIDHKFQLRMRSIYQKTIQFRNYALAASKNTLVINYIRLTKKFDNTTLAREITSFQPGEHFIWKQRLIRMFDSVANSIKSDSFEHRWGSCQGKYGYQCDFTPICEEWSADLIQIKKQSMFHQKEVWKPW